MLPLVLENESGAQNNKLKTYKLPCPRPRMWILKAST